MKKSARCQITLLVMLYTLPCFLLTSCAISPHDAAAWTTQQKVLSSDGKFIAAYSVSNDMAGGTGSSYEIVTVKDTQRSYRAEECIAIKMKRGYEVRLRWVGEQNLVIDYPETAEIVQKTNQVGSVKIRFVPQPALYGMFKVQPVGAERAAQRSKVVPAK